jgi:zinc transporter 1/2/3
MLMTFGTEVFDGLALGSRLAYLALPHRFRYVPFLGALLYGIMTPIGIAMGVSMRMIYDPSSIHTSLFSGVLESLSAGILVYSGFVELPANGFLFKPEMRETGI